MGLLVYTLCAAAALCCAVLLLRAHRQNGVRLLFWSGLCFVGLTLNNTLTVVDLFVVPHLDLFILRNAVALLAILLLVHGLVWETR